MARENVTTQQITRPGLNPVLTASTAEGDVIDSGEVALWVDNATAGAVNVTVEATATQDGLEVEDLVVSVPIGEVRLIGPFPKRTFGRVVESADVGRVYVNYADPAITRAVVGF